MPATEALGSFESESSCMDLRMIQYPGVRVKSYAVRKLGAERAFPRQWIFYSTYLDNNIYQKEGLD
jgi:hypothetical protein